MINNQPATISPPFLGLFPLILTLIIKKTCQAAILHPAGLKIIQYLKLILKIKTDRPCFDAVTYPSPPHTLSLHVIQHLGAAAYLIIRRFIRRDFLDQTLQPQFLQFIQQQPRTPFKNGFQFMEADDFK